MTILKKLGFHSELVSSKSIAVDQLTKRLKALHGEFKILEQDKTDLASLATVSSELLSPKLMENRDKGVRVLVACCLVDILRISVPEPPFSLEQLQTILAFVSRQLVFATDQNNPYFPYALYMIQNLAIVRCMSLVSDIDNHAELFMAVMTIMFENVKKTTPITIITYFVEILAQIIESIPQITQDHVEYLLSHLIGTDESSPVFKLASEVIIKSQDRIHVNIAHYFNEVIVPSKEEMELEKMKQVHQIVVVLHSICEGVLMNVIPQIEAELKVDDVNLRFIATKCLGQMFTARGSTLAKNYINVWLSWMQKRNDKNTVIRLCWLDFAFDMIRNHSDRSKEILEALQLKLMDPDEKVRKATLGVLTSIVDSKNIDIIESMPRKMMEDLAERCKDKRPNVHKEAITLVGKIYAMVYPDLITATTPVMSEKFGWLPGLLVSLFTYTDNLELQIHVEKVLEETLFQASNFQENQRKLVYVFACMNDSQRQTLISHYLSQDTLMHYLSAYVEICISSKGNISSSGDAIKKVIKTLNLLLSDTSSVVDGLKQFLASNNQSLYALMKTSLSSRKSHKDLLKARDQMMRRLDNPFKSLFEIVFKKVMSPIFTVDMTSYFVQVASGAIKDGSINSIMQVSCQKLIRMIAKSSPDFFSKYLTEFLVAVSENDIKGRECFLYAIKQVIAKQPVEIDVIAKDSMETIIRESENYREVKYAAAVLAQTKSVESHEISSYIEEMVTAIESNDNNHQVARAIVCLTQFMRYRKELLDSETVSKVNKTVTDRVLQDNYEAVPDNEDNWVAEDKISAECLTKTFSLKWMREVVQVSKEVNQFKTFAQLVFDILQQEGESSHEKSSSFAYKTRLRLTAALNILKLVQNPQFEQAVKPKLFNLLSLTVQDACYEVRETFIRKLMKYTSDFSVHIRYLAALILVAFEPEEELKQEVTDYLAYMFSLLRTKQSVILPESIFPRLIHLLAHHPDFSADSAEDASIVIDFLDYFFGIILNRENASYLYQVGNEVKQTRDRTDEKSVNIYVVADLAQMIIQRKCAAQGWPLQSFSGRIPLPNIFVKIEDVNEATATVRKNFIPAELRKTNK